MKNASRFIGGILLVSGTSIGAGMLALPVITSFGGFFPSLGLLFLSWAFLFCTAWLLLDVTLAFPKDANLMTMASGTLGSGGRLLCWLTYLFLLYALTAAYIAGSAPLFLQFITFLTGWSPPNWLGPLPLLLIFGFFVYMGTRAVDRANRLLMTGLLIVYFLLLSFLPPHIDTSLLFHSNLSAIWLSLPVIITSYGFHIIIPTLSTYLDRQKKKLRLTLLIGSLIPFVVYVLWEYLILGVVPLVDLKTAWQKGETSVVPLSLILQPQNFWLSTLASLFSFFAIITSFLGVSLSLSDFLTDGLKMERYSFGREISSLLTFVPPLFFVYTYPRGFILALQYAGIFVVILLCILPALMAWTLPHYRRRRLLLSLVLLFSFAIIAIDLLEQLGMFIPLVTEESVSDYALPQRARRSSGAPGCVGLATNFRPSLVSCSRTMQLAPGTKICAASLSYSQLFNLSRYTCFI